MANKLFQLLATITGHRPAIEAALHDDDRQEFFREFEQLAEAAADDPAADEDTWQQLVTLLNRYPQARAALPETAFTPPNPAADGPQASAPAAGALAPSQRPTTAKQAPATTTEPPGRPADGRPSPVHPPGVRSSISLQWTREIITAVIAVVILAGTAWVVYRAVVSVGNATRYTAIKDLLTILLGPVGVVIGYYFGKGPAESQAAEATNRADAAIAGQAEVRAKAQLAASDIERLEEIQLTGGQARAEATAASMQELRAIRDRLRAI